MRYKALVIDDNPEFTATVRSILQSLDDECDTVSNQREARQQLGSPDCPRYDYVLLDLEIPVNARGDLPRIQNGKNLLSEILRVPNLRRSKVIVMTGHELDTYELAVSVMELGAHFFIGKPKLADELDGIIGRLLEPPRPVDPIPIPVGLLEPFPGGTVYLFDDYLEICNVRIPVRGMLHEVLVALAGQLSSGARVSYSGGRLAKLVGADGSNTVAGMIHRFRVTVQARGRLWSAGPDRQRGLWVLLRRWGPGCAWRSCCGRRA